MYDSRIIRGVITHNEMSGETIDNPGISWEELLNTSILYGASGIRPDGIKWLMFISY